MANQKSSVTLPNAPEEDISPGSKDDQTLSNGPGSMEIVTNSNPVESSLLTATLTATEEALIATENQKSSVTLPNAPEEDISPGSKDDQTFSKGPGSMEIVTNSNPVESPLTATIIIAAPFVKDHFLAMTGEDPNFGKWNQSRGKFESISVINEDLHIFKGIVPIPSIIGSPFKFVQVNIKNQKMEYEGDGKKENRQEEILPDSWNFFIFMKPKSNIITHLWKKAMDYLIKPKIKEEITCKFVEILFNHTLEKILPEWDDAFEFLDEGLKKIQCTLDSKEDGSVLIDGFKHFFDLWIQEPELQFNFDRLFLLIVGACKLKVYSKEMRPANERMETKEFYLYLHNFSHLKRKHEDLLAVFEFIARHGGSNFWWIFFRINRHSEELAKKQNHEVSQSLLKTLREIPEALLDDQEHASRVVDYLVRYWKDSIDALYDNLGTILTENAKYQPILESLLLHHFVLHKSTVDDSKKIIRSKFMTKAFQSTANSKDKFVESVETIFNNKKLLDIMSLAFDTPDNMLPIVAPIVESNVSKKLEKIATLSKEEINFFSSHLEKDRFNDLPKAKQQIEHKLLNAVIDTVKLGVFQDVKSVKLILLALAKMNISFLTRPEIVDLQKAVDSLPQRYFQNLHAALNKPKVSVYTTLKPYCKGETKTIARQVETHFEQLDQLIKRIRNRQIPLNKFPVLKDPRVLDLLKFLGLTERNQTELYQKVEELRECHKLYGSLYSKFSHSTRKADSRTNDENTESIQILDSEEWRTYLAEIDSEKSLLTLEDAIKLKPPLQSTSGRWLLEIKDNFLFLGILWNPRIASLQNYPLDNRDLQVLINDCATEWEEMARNVAEGSVHFKEMDDIIRLQPDPNLLSRNHLQSQPIDGVLAAYRNFKILQELRQLIGPFVAALRLFSIRDKEQIDKLYDFVENNLLKDWDSKTLAQVEVTEILRMVNDDLQFDPKRPETRNVMLFLSSLVTIGGNRSPLIEWLRKKNENDMEAMGKILQGNLLEAYGQIQTLRTRIASFIQKEFNTFHDLLREIRKSEEHFAQRTSGRVPEIKCNWLVTLLPEIDAAVRASIISPSEDAKEKLAKLRRVVIEPKNESYSIEIRLEPEGSLSTEELKQAFQLLDMTLMDDRHDGDDFIGRTRRNVEQIEQLSEVFGFLFTSGCITYTFDEQIKIELADLDKELRHLREQLEEWNSQWREIEQMPLLALFSRGYLLQLVDLIARKKTKDVVSILKILLPSAASKMEIDELVKRAPCISSDGKGWLSTNEIFIILKDLHKHIENVFQRTPELVHIGEPALSFLNSYRRTLKSHFNLYTAVVILNVSQELLVGSALVAYSSLTRQPIEPTRILFVTTNTDIQEVERFMKLWSMAIDKDIFIIAHVERLTAACINAVRESVDRVLPEHRAKLLLLAQHQHDGGQSTKTLGARLGLVFNRLLDINVTTDQLRQCLSILLPKSEQVHFYTSNIPGCGKSQQAMKNASELKPIHDYYRICVRTGTVEELLASLKRIENKESATFLHLDVAHSISDEFNDILLSLLMYGALYDPKKAKLGYWMMSPLTTIAVEFASPFDAKRFPIIAYLGKHHICQCDKSFFTYDLAEIPCIIGKQVTVHPSDALIVAGKFLQLKQQVGQEGLRIWDDLCSHPENLINNPLAKDVTFTLLVTSFERFENQNDPTFSSLNAMATFLYRHICVMIHSVWFNCSAVHLFDSEDLARVFKLNIFDMLLKVANDCITRCWSIVNQENQLHEMDWNQRQRAMFLLGRLLDMNVTGMNIVGRNEQALKQMFDPKLLPTLQLQGLKFQELGGFQNLVKSSEGSEVILNALRSLLLLDGTESSIEKVNRLDNHNRNTPASQRLHKLIGENQGYVLTGDNITKMMFALYRIRCGLPVVVFGETGVGKTALFRFLIETFLGHTFEVCNVNSGTIIQDVEELVQSAIEIINDNPKAQVFLFLDEMNTADHPVIAFIKELMLDRHCHGFVLPENLHLIGAANPYRYLKKTDREAAVGLAFRFAQRPAQNHQGRNSDGRNLVYRVNALPLAFYDHIYDFGHLYDEAENTYIDEICQYGLPKSIFSDDNVKQFIGIIKKSHKVARELSVDRESAVSLRDASRAVQLFCWFCQSPAGQMLSEKNQVKATDLTIYLVYAFRFRAGRETFLNQVFGENQSASKNMTSISRFITKKLYEKAHGASIGSGAIALNDALCENLFALYVCVLNGIFLIIIGRPGSSKSLSVEILKLVLSPGNYILRRELGDLPALTELYFQCSPMSTSSGFKALFESAQRLSVDPKMMKAMVVLDELGLADISPEKPIKVLHSELERQSFLTSGRKQQSPYSVIALSNWIVDAAQVNRGILVLRTQADKKDLLESAKQLADSLIAKFSENSNRELILKTLTESLKTIVDIYQELDEREDIGGGSFFSMRDFFFCVKNYACSVVWGPSSDVHISPDLLVQAAIRNFGGHGKAREVVKRIMVDDLQIPIPETSPLDLIVKNILDSSKPESIHIARHLMVLNRSLIGLQLLSRHVKTKLDKGTSWNIIFGSCFPGDLQVTAVTRKLRQVEQAIRAGGVLVLCHADQLFESLYMVLNQQYWTQGDVTMTQIALGPSNRAIALPSGPFRIIALQDTDLALNRKLMSPAVLSRFEKHELRSSHLLNADGLNCRRSIESHPVWLAVPEDIKRQKFIYGYHDESFDSLALHFQEKQSSRMEVEEDEEIDRHFENTWMRSINPMAMIKLECADSSNDELQEVCQRYRNKFVLESLNDALQNSKSNRMVIMTNTLRHLEIGPMNLSTCQHLVIQLFEIQSELEFVRRLESIRVQHLSDPDFCLIVQYDAVTGPIEQFQLAKYEVEQRFQKTDCRVVFIVHVDPRPVNLNWVFSFGDDWDYFFVDDIVRGLADQHQIALKELVQSPTDTPLSSFIEEMSIESFKSLLFEMLGPNLQTNLVCLHSFLGQFYCGIRTALGLPDNQRLVELLKECLLAQLKGSSIIWNIVDAVSDASFDSSSSLSNGLWGVFKQKISKSLAHVLVVSDVWHVSDQWSIELWCDFFDTHYPHRLLSPVTSDSVVQMPIGFRICTRPLGRLLASFQIAQNINEPLQWLLKRLSENEDDNSQEIKQAYFRDWFLLRIHPHLHSCLKKVPLSKMSYLVDDLFDEPDKFFRDWDEVWEAKVIAALELFSIASFAKSDGNLWDDVTSRINSWEIFIKEVARLSLRTLALPDVMKSKETFIMAVSSIEMNSALMNILNRMQDLDQLWLGLRTTKRILLFNPESEFTFPKSLINLTAPKELIDNLTELVINSVIRPRVGSRENIRSATLNTLMKSTSACRSEEELAKILGECPTHDSIVLLEENVVRANNDGVCSSCNQPLTAIEVDGEGQTHPVNHLRAPKAAVIESLFRDHQKFMFLFERVGELFIQQRKNNPRDIQTFLNFLLSSDCRLNVSWRFLTVIVRTVLSTDVESKKGSDIIDELLLNIHCNRPIHELNSNAYNLLLALVVCFDQDVENNVDEKRLQQDFIQAAMTGHWNTRRIRQLAHIRRQLAEDENRIEDIITRWSTWRNNQNDDSVTNSLLFFVLRLCSHEGDETQLRNIFHNPLIAHELRHQTVINNYIKTLSPLSLGFTLQSADRTANPFQERLLNGDHVGGAFEHYSLLLNIQPDWAPFIARLAYHAFDIFEAKRISLFGEMTSNLDATAHLFLPGIENHPLIGSFSSPNEQFRWYVCSCRTLCYLGDCGNPVAASICPNCRVALGRVHVLRKGVRKANDQDFQPPKGISVTRIPPTAPAFAARNCSPAVTRFALLLNSLALMNVALNPQITPQVICNILSTLPLTERQQGEDRHSFMTLLSNHIIVHLDLLCQLLVTSRLLTMTDKFRIGHLLLHKLLASSNASFLVNSSQFKNGTQAREEFERGLTELLKQQTHLAEELDQKIAVHLNEASKRFRQSLSENETSHWAYARRILANRQSVQLELARNDPLQQNYPFLNFLLDHENGMRKLNALQHFGEALRFIALVRTILSGKITQEEANQLSIAQGLEKMTEIVIEKGIILDRGRVVTSRDHVMSLFNGFKQLWDRFSQLENAEKKTFLDYFECQQVDINVRPNTVLDQTAPLILICAGTEPLEAMFSCQLLNHAVEAASSIALNEFIQPHCRKDSGRVRLCCSSAATLADFDESLYAQVSTEEVDDFIRDHVIDRSTLPLAESFAMSAILGSAGSTIAEELFLDVIPEFKFKDDTESGNYLLILERRSLVWQPTPIPHAIQELILADLEKSRSLAEARSVLISAITHLHHSNTEPLIISQIRNSFLSDVLETLLKLNILTESHMSDATKTALNRHLKLEVRHVFGLLKAISFRMKGGDVDGRVPDGWTTTMSESLAKQTRAKLLTEPGDGIVDTLLQLINNVAASEPVPVWLRPSESLLLAIRQIEGSEWNGIPAEIKMENIGHVLRIAESLPKT